MGKRMDDWLRNMGDWNISRRRYYGLPLPFYPCALRAPERDRLAAPSSRERAVGRLDQLEELRRPWIDEVPIRCEACGETVRARRRGRRRLARRGHRPVLDARLAERRATCPEGYATGAAKGLTTADLPDHAYWEEWFPADWVSEMREQIRLWFYSQLFMSVVLDRAGAVPAGARLREDARRDGPRDARLVGEHDRRRGRVRADGRRRDALAVLRAAARPEPPVRLRAGARDQAQAADALELGRRSSSSYANVEGFEPPLRRPRARTPATSCSRSTAGSSRARDAFVRDATAGYEALAHGRRDPRLRGVPRRPLELVHPPLAAALLGRRRGGAPHALVRARPDAARDRAGDAVPHRAPLAEPRREPCDGAPDSVHLARLAGGRPSPTATLLAEIAEVRRVVELGRQARATPGIEAAPAAAAARRRGCAARRPRTRRRSRDELRVKEVEFGVVEAVELRVKPNLPVLGPKLGAGARRGARGARGGRRSRSSASGRFRVAGHELEPDEVLVERAGREGWAVASEDGVTVALDTHARRRAAARGRVYDLIRHVNSLRKETGPRADRPDRAHDPAGRRRPARARGLDQGRDARGRRLETGNADTPVIAKA